MRKYKMVKMEHGVNDVISEIEYMFNQWLNVSGLTNEGLLRYKNVPVFCIREEEEDTFSDKIIIGYYDNEFKKIGLPFIVSRDNKEELMSLALILLYISNKLDNENLKEPLNKQRKGYFTNITRSFIKTNSKFKSLNLNE